MFYTDRLVRYLLYLWGYELGARERNFKIYRAVQYNTARKIDQSQCAYLTKL